MCFYWKLRGEVSKVLISKNKNDSFMKVLSTKYKQVLIKFKKIINFWDTVFFVKSFQYKRIHSVSTWSSKTFFLPRFKSSNGHKLLAYQDSNCILRISWQQKITNKEVLRGTGLTTMYFTLSQRRLCLLGHVLRMGAEQIPKSLLYSELVLANATKVV